MEQAKIEFSSKPSENLLFFHLAVETSHNNSSGGVSLEEEIVEIDAPDETDANITGEDNNDTAVVNADVGLNEAIQFLPRNFNYGLVCPFQ